MGLLDRPDMADRRGDLGGHEKRACLRGLGSRCTRWSMGLSSPLSRLAPLARSISGPAELFLAHLPVPR
jgi:hypothetical protein